MRWGSALHDVRVNWIQEEHIVDADRDRQSCAGGYMLLSVVVVVVVVVVAGKSTAVGKTVDQVDLVLPRDYEDWFVQQHLCTSEMWNCLPSYNNYDDSSKGHNNFL